MPDDKRTPQDDKADWALFLLALQEGIGDVESFIKNGWDKFIKGANGDADKLRNQLVRYADELDYDGLTLDSGYRSILAVQNRFDLAARNWADVQRGRLGIEKVKTKKDDAAAILVAGVLWGVDSGGPAKMATRLDDEIDLIYRDTSRIAKRAGIAGSDKLKRRPSTGRASTRMASRSWLENIVLAIESSIHGARAPIIDATSGPMRRPAIREAALKFKPQVNRLELSYKTHQRAAVRSALGDMGKTLGATSWMYWMPSSAKSKMSPSGFGSKHFGQIKNETQWEGVRKSLGAKRAGSYIFSTGFHVGDPGYLLPIPPKFKEAATEYARKNRQKLLAKLEARNG